MNKLYFGDNLDILREHIKDESVDLIYLDPPFNSNANYNVLFKTPKGHESAAQIEAFEDTWHWNEQAEREFGELVRGSNTDVSEMVQALRRFLGENDMMANRLIELHRVLKPTGSLYLHCDPTASHYLKIVLDGVFGKENFKNEIIWKRADTVKGNTGQGSKFFDRNTDSILFYSKSDEQFYCPQYKPYTQEYIDDFYKHVEEKTGRRYQLISMTGPGGASKGNPEYEVMGITRFWRYSKVKMEQLIKMGMVVQTNPDTVPRRKLYLDEGKGVPIQSLWDDITALHSQASERLGYPTQKPLALLERIIQASSNEGDVVLDPFCGCGTAVHAAQKLGRQWLGIDITHLAVSLIEKRMKDAFPGIVFEVEGTPKDLEGAQNLALRDKYQFQWWACSLVGAQPFQGKKKGADDGIDGLIYFNDDGKMPKKIIVSVKGGENVSVAMVRDLAHVVEREKAEIGLFVTLAEATRPMREEAVKTGYYALPNTQHAYPKIQILTIAGLLSGIERPQYPNEASFGAVTFKKAKVEEKTSEQKGLF